MSSPRQIEDEEFWIPHNPVQNGWEIEPYSAALVKDTPELGGCMPGENPSTDQDQLYKPDDQVFEKRERKDGQKVRNEEDHTRYYTCCAERDANGKLIYKLKDKPKNKGGKTIKLARQKELRKFKKQIEYQEETGETNDNGE
ncbi:uncharacterized protein KY384_001444 [Bacidia gigantensis]|uniref:uncharacterized protein n=1 Tax=Bacidia gigantensis TaxID=2732470 RepID=UPI001D041901|nr:uncharacterized protein KY384_001444 [Bacidia gigantensis]KAG8533703.1 hypothetical protein KY384_001444 [Bacidia gigantensis]